MRSRELRGVVLAANLVYVIALLLAAYNAWVAANRPPGAPEADWAAFDAAMFTILAGVIVAYAGAHLLATRHWLVGGGAGCVIATTLTLASYLTLTWLFITWLSGFGNTNEPGWLVVVTAIVAATITGIADQCRRLPDSN
jgi:hypothetical protein